MVYHPHRRLPLLLVLLLSLASPLVAATTLSPTPVPAFTHTGEDDWLGSKPLTWKALQGKVVLLDVWTFDCWNCYRSFPWLNGVEQRFGDQPFQVIGIHSPEFDHERDHQRIRAKMTEYQLHHPVMVDNDMSYWRALNNRYWPSYYLVDGKGRLRYSFVGETHQGTPRAEAIETAIQQLLQELTQD